MDFGTFISNIGTVADSSVLDILIVLFGTFALSSFIGWVYKKTYSGNKYKQSYVQTIIIMPIIISMIMMIVGSNVATAFTMMGALSIVRFRNSLKDTRDLGFIFFSIVVGMAMGIKFYLLGIIGTFAISFIIYLMHKLNLFGEEQFVSQTLKIKTTSLENFENTFSNVLEKYTNSYVLEGTDLSSVLIDENGNEKNLIELTYKITNNFDLDISRFLGEIRLLNGNNQILLIND